MIQLIEVTKAFKNNVVLDRISMDFHDGDFPPAAAKSSSTVKISNPSTR